MTCMSNTHTQWHAEDSPDQMWDDFVRCHGQAHFLQTSRWGSFKSSFGWRAERITLDDGRGRVVAGASVLYRRAVGLTLAYVPKGPLVDWHNPDCVRQLLHKMEMRCRQQGVSVLKIEPDLADSLHNRSLLTGYGFHPSSHSVQPRSTILLDIGLDQEAILQRMKSKWRYNIRLAQRKDVAVRVATRNDLPHFHELMQTTAVRDGFAVHSAAYYDTAFDLFVPDDAVFLFAEYDKQPLAAIVVFITGRTAWYVWGASSNHERSRMPNHALQWAAIQWAKARGATMYDFWGIPDEIGQVAFGCARGSGIAVPIDDLPIDVQSLPAGDLWGVYRLKQGFGGNVVRSVGAWDKPLHPIGHRLYLTGLWIQHKVPEVRRSVSILHQQLRTEMDFLNTVIRDSFQPTHPSTTMYETSTTLRQGLSIESREEWEALLNRFPAPHILQSWEWGSVKAQTGWQATRLGISDQSGNPLGAFQFLWRQPISSLPLCIGYVPKGPIVDWTHEAAVDAVLEQIIEYARARHCIFVKIDPDVRENGPEGQRLLHKLRTRHWRYSSEQIQFKNTAFSALTGSDEEMLEGMKSKWRYNIRLAERRGITVREGTAADFGAFYKLYAETGQRDHFLIRPLDYYTTVWQTMLAAQEKTRSSVGGVLLLAEHAEENAPLAGIFVMRYGRRAWYFYGASSEHRRRDMPNYLLQWEALRWARNQGCAVYDWWGAPSQIDDPDDTLQGVWRFKQGFGAEFQQHIGAWDWPISPLLYRAYTQLIPHILSVVGKARGHQQRIQLPSP